MLSRTPGPAAPPAGRRPPCSGATPVTAQPRFLTFSSLPAYEWLDRAVWVIDPGSGRRIWSNRAGFALWPSKAPDTLDALQARGVSTDLRAVIDAVHSGATARLAWHLATDRDAELRLLSARATGILTPDGRVALLVTAHAPRAPAAGTRLRSEKRLLEMVSRDIPLRVILEAIVADVQRECPGLLCAVHALKDGRLHGLAAPNLPISYTWALEGVPVGEGVGSCGTACHRGEPVIVGDIENDPLWRDYRELALAHGLRACWSIPLKTARGDVLGSFAAYYRVARGPTAHEMSVLQSAKHIAAIAIEREQAAAAIERGREQLQMILDALPIMIVYVDMEQRCRFINQAYENWFGVRREDVIGRTTREIVGDALYQQLWPQVSRALEGEDVRFERESVDALGRTHYLDVHYLPHFDAAGRMIGHFGIVNDITAHKESEQMLQHLATHDQLTQLPNRSLFGEQLHIALGRALRNGRRLAVLFVDLDRFKNVNDTLGHGAGDRLLHLVANRFRATVRASDTVARLGGDEFVVLMDEVDDNTEAAVLAQKLIHVLTEPVSIDGQDLYVSASIGIAVAPEDGRDPATLLKNADIAMYRAKHQGRNGFQFFSPEATAASLEHLRLESDLRKALERNEFVLCFQPILDLATGGVVGVETLLRWRHPELGMVPPASFIGLAEETGLIVPIGAWVLEEACRRFANEPLFADLRVAVNLSPRQFRVRDLHEQIADILARTGLDPARLDLEVTESSMMDNPEAATRILQGLRDTGVRISIDDFGTGYSSLSFLKRFPIDCLKVDQSFVRDVVDDEDAASIARAVIAMGRSLRLTITAEGVETDEQFAFLRDESCHKAQGYLFSRPLEIDALRDWLAAR
jgi:diguanylate cyclase (GGDEF)-like protein/PAS domain S-box-containing protein